jgi:hypothetical protein
MVEEPSAAGGCVQAGTDAAELPGNGTVNYIDFADSCFKANIQTIGDQRWTQNPTGILRRRLDRPEVEYAKRQRPHALWGALLRHQLVVLELR